jgi:hypothetical protein
MNPIKEVMNERARHPCTIERSIAPILGQPGTAENVD